MKNDGASSAPQQTSDFINEVCNNGSISSISKDFPLNSKLKNNDTSIDVLADVADALPNNQINESGVVDSNASTSIPDSDEDEYITSGDNDAFEAPEVSPNTFRHLTFGSGFAEHTAVFEKSLNEALNSVALDSSLVLQAQVSGKINDKANILLEKQVEIEEYLLRLKTLHKQYISDNRLGVFEKDIDYIVGHINQFKYGCAKTSLFGKKFTGVVHQYPIEYNQAKDKVLER